MFGLILTDDNEQESNDYQGNDHLHLWKKQHTVNTFLITLDASNRERMTRRGVGVARFDTDKTDDGPPSCLSTTSSCAAVWLGY